MKWVGVRGSDRLLGGAESIRLLVMSRLSSHISERRMASDRTETVAIMAAIIYAGRTGESAQAPNEKVFGVIAKAAWDLHKAVVDADQVPMSQAGFRQP